MKFVTPITPQTSLPTSFFFFSSFVIFVENKIRPGVLIKNITNTDKHAPPHTNTHVGGAADPAAPSGNKLVRKACDK